MRNLYVTTKGACNFRVNIEENNQAPDAAIAMNWCQGVRDAGMYFDEESQGVYPWHSILSVEVIND